MAIQDDWAISYPLLTVEHTAGATVYSVNELYSWLQGEFDELSALDDQIPMQALTPTVYKWLNGWSMELSADDGHEYLSGGSLESSGGNDLWPNLYSIGSQVGGTNLYIIQDGAKVAQWWGTGNIDILLQVKSGGSLIDGGNVRIFGREFGDLYDHNDVGLSGGGRNVVGINTANDTNNDDDPSAVSAYGLSWNFGTSSFDLNNGAGAQPYTCWINCNGLYLASAYEQMKYEVRRGATGQSFLLPDATSGDGEQYLAASAAFTSVKTAAFGTFAGGTYFGARGVWIYNYHGDDAQNFQLIDQLGVTQAPPNTVNVKVTSLLSGDRIFVGPLVSAGGELNDQQYTLSGAHASGDLDIYLNEVINTSSTPQSGWMRVGDYRHEYSTWANDGPSGHFTLLSAIGSGTPGPAAGYSGGEDSYVTFIDWETAISGETSNTMIQSETVPVIIRVRRKGILPFEVTSNIDSGGMTIGAIRVTDGIVANPETSAG